MKIGKIELHPLCLPWAGFLVLTGQGKRALAVLGLVTVHELAHLTAGMACGLRPTGFCLTPLGERLTLPGLESLSLPRRILIYAAGPAVSLLLGRWSRNSLWLGLLNLLPVLPLDGGGILAACLGDRESAERAMAVPGQVVGGILAGVGGVQAVLYPGNLTLLLLGVFLWRENRNLARKVRWRALLREILEGPSLL